MSALKVYVDDFLIMSIDNNELLNVNNYLQKSFKVKDLGIAKCYLGINVLQNDGHTVLRQAKYIAILLRNFNMYECKSVSTLIDGPKCKTEFTKLDMPENEANEDKWRKAISAIM